MMTVLTACSHLSQAKEKTQQNIDIAQCEEGSITAIENLINQHNAILVGETHGTAEMPATFTNIVTKATQSKTNIIIALEFSEKWQVPLNQFINANDESTANKHFAAIFTSDGRTSASMREMLNHLRQLSISGAPVKIVAVDYWPENEEDALNQSLPDWLPDEVDKDKRFVVRDIVMGMNAVEACRQEDCDLLLYYAGNAHTKRSVSKSSTFNTATGEITEQTTAPAGFIIQHYLNATSILLGHRGGEIQAITEKGFGSHSQKPTMPAQFSNDFVPYCLGGDRGHDWIISVGELSSSS